MERDQLFVVHERPGPGIYRCVERPAWVVSIKQRSESLPPCFGENRFQNVHYRRVVDLSTAVQEHELQLA